MHICAYCVCLCFRVTVFAFGNLKKKNKKKNEHMSRVWHVNILFHTLDRCLFILVDSRLKISLEKKSRQSQAESSDFILNPAITRYGLQC